MPKPRPVLFSVLLALLPCAARAQETPPAPTPPVQGPIARRPVELLKKKMPDGVWMAADHYQLGEERRDPGVIVVAFHMAAGSRGEYRNIAHEFVERGCEVLAVDLRSGGTRFDVPNMTVQHYAQLHKREKAKPIDAYGDIGFAVAWARELAPESKVVLLGSSWSAALVLVYAGREPAGADMVLAYSPGEHVEGLDVAETAKAIRVPVFVSCGNGVDESGPVQLVSAGIPPEHLTLFIPPHTLSAEHGALSLWVRPTEHRKPHWEQVEKMLARLK